MATTTTGREKVNVPFPLQALSAEPPVSVLISNYNYADFVGEAIESVLGQSYRNLEVVVCDDGSTDGSAQVIKRYAGLDARVKPIFKENGGQASGFNAAYAASSGEIVCLLDADDLYAPEKIATAVSRLRAGNHGIFLHRLLWMGRDGMPLPWHTPHAPLREGWIGEDVAASGKGTWCPEPTTAMSFRREVADLVFPIPESMRICADAFLFTMLLLVTPIVVSDERLGRYRIHGSNSWYRDVRTKEIVSQDRERLLMINEEINLRLEELGIHDLRFDADRSVTFHLQGLSIELLEGRSRPHLLRSYARSVRRLLQGNDFSRRRRGKLEIAFVYAVAIVLPARYRQWWLSRARGWMAVASRQVVARLRAAGRRPKSRSR